MTGLAALATSFISDVVTNAGPIEISLLAIFKKKEAGDLQISRR